MPAERRGDQGISPSGRGAIWRAPIGLLVPVHKLSPTQVRDFSTENAFPPKSCLFAHTQGLGDLPAGDSHLPRFEDKPSVRFKSIFWLIPYNAVAVRGNHGWTGSGSGIKKKDEKTPFGSGN